MAHGLHLLIKIPVQLDRRVVLILQHIGDFLRQFVRILSETLQLWKPRLVPFLFFRCLYVLDQLPLHQLRRLRRYAFLDFLARIVLFRRAAQSLRRLRRLRSFPKSPIDHRALIVVFAEGPTGLLVLLALQRLLRFTQTPQEALLFEY